MIPVLFEANSTSFNSNGLGRLSDCISCLVTEERNGIYEVEFIYPIDGIHYADIGVGKIIIVTHDDRKDKQPFVIYRRSAPISGEVVFNAHHISYWLSHIVVSPFTATSVASALQGIEQYSMNTNPFTFWTDKTSSGNFDVSVPTSCRALLGGQEGSILDSFGGGDYEFDNYTVKLYADRGTDSGVVIRYGKNLIDLVSETNVMNLYTAVVPYWSDGEETVYGGIVTGITADVHRVVPMDLSSDFSEEPTVSQLETRAAALLASNRPWLPEVNVMVDFVALWQTEEYKAIAPLERVRLCDTVTVRYDALGVNVQARVIRTVWNALLDRYDKIEIGDSQVTFSDTIVADTTELMKNVPNMSMMNSAIQHATDLITGGLGGHVVFMYDADGKPTEILVMDTDDVTTAVNVLRINVNGIGFSSSGINGPYRSAWTLDGQFVADFITTGTMSANRINGGTLILGGAGNGDGVLIVNSAYGSQICKLYNGGVDITKGRIRIDKDSDNWTEISDNGFFIGIAESTVSTGNIQYVNSYYMPDNTMLGYLDIEYSPYIRALISPVECSLYHNSAGASIMNPGSLAVQNAGNTIYCKVVCNRINNYAPSFKIAGMSANIDGNLTVTGTKNRLVETKDYGQRLMYSYETMSPLFGDVGEGVISEDGKCYVMIDNIFAETVSLKQYQVALQKYGAGDCWVSERKGDHFIVEGTPGLSFGWEIKAKQADYEQRRIDKYEEEIAASNEKDYAGELAHHIEQIKKERQVA